MRVEERAAVLSLLTASEAKVLGLVEGLTAEQWSFREGPERWSIAENVEHLIVFEGFIRGVIERALGEEAAPEKSAEVAQKEHLAMGLAGSRGLRLQSREGVRPVGRWSDPGLLVAELKAARARTMTYAAEVQGELREHFFPHIAFGDLDCYQWLVVMAQHMERHALQIEDVMRDPGFPA